MDTKKKMNKRFFAVLWSLVGGLSILSAQNVDKIQFCSTEYGNAEDSITIKFNLLDEDGTHIKNVRIGNLYNRLRIYENDVEILSGEYQSLTGGIRIPKETTISFVVDQGIDSDGK